MACVECMKEEECCRAARASIRAFEAGVRKGHYDGTREGEAWRAYTRDLIDECGKKIRRANLAYANSQPGEFPPDD